MSSASNHYQILKVTRDAPDTVIRAAYKTLMQQYHPDKFQGDPKLAHEISLQLQLAYDILIDRQQRANYDQWLAQQERRQTQYTALQPNRQSKNGIKLIKLAIFLALIGIIIQLFDRQPSTQPPALLSPLSTNKTPHPTVTPPKAAEPPVRSKTRQISTPYWTSNHQSVMLNSTDLPNGGCLGGRSVEEYEDGALFVSCVQAQPSGQTELDILLPSVTGSYISAGYCQQGVYHFYQASDCTNGIYKAKQGDRVVYSDQQNASEQAKLALGARVPKYWHKQNEVGQAISVQECERIFEHRPDYHIGPCAF